MENKIEFECIKDYIMNNGEISFLKGKVYNVYSKKNDNKYQFINEQKDNHNLTIDDEFHQHFKLLNNAHYKTDTIDVIDFCKLYDLNFNEGNVIKYVSRARRKGTHIEDLKKAIDYLNREIKYLENANN